MSIVTVFVGLDYHDRVVQACVLDREGHVLVNRSCANDWRQIADVVPAGAQVFCAIEACTGAADLADELIRQAAWSVDLAHPGYVARLKQSPDKTDYADARLLADLERVGYLPKVWLAPRSVQELRRLVRYRQQLAGERRNAKLRIGALLREQRIATTGRRWTNAWVNWLRTFEGLSDQSRWIIDRHLARLEFLRQEIVAVEKRLAGVTEGDPIVRWLTAQPGVGLVTAVMLRAEIGRFDRFRSGKQLARFCGLSPRNASSGQRQADAGLIKAGNPQLRAVLVEASHRLQRFDPRWRQLGTALRRRHKAGSVVAAAVANRWVRWLYHQLKSLAV